MISFEVYIHIGIDWICIALVKANCIEGQQSKIGKPLRMILTLVVRVRRDRAMLGLGKIGKFIESKIYLFVSFLFQCWFSELSCYGGMVSFMQLWGMSHQALILSSRDT